MKKSYFRSGSPSRGVTAAVVILTTALAYVSVNQLPRATQMAASQTLEDPILAKRSPLEARARYGAQLITLGHSQSGASESSSLGALQLGAVSFARLAEESAGMQINARRLRTYSALNLASPIREIVVPESLVEKDSELFEIEFSTDRLGSYVLRWRPRDMAVLYAVRGVERRPLNFFEKQELKGEEYRLSFTDKDVRLGDVVVVEKPLQDSSLKINTNLRVAEFRQVKISVDDTGLAARPRGSKSS